MAKVLTISIAAYNVESYIKQGLDSIVNSGVVDELEVFVVDDGGKDGTLAIAQEYEARFPESIHAIHKENGGYGSTVNWSITHATGSYFKLLDGDDWFDSNALALLVQALRTTDSDVVIMPYNKCYEDGTIKTTEHCYPDAQKNVVLDINQIRTDKSNGMWALAYRTGLLQACKLELPEHCLYTDQIYCTIPWGLAQTFVVLDCNVYQYRLGREGQSVSRQSRIKHIGSQVITENVMCQFYEQTKGAETNRQKYIRRRITTYAKRGVSVHLLAPISKEIMAQVAEHDTHIKELSQDIYKCMASSVLGWKFRVFICIVRLFNYNSIALLFAKLILPKNGIKNWD